MRLIGRRAERRSRREGGAAARPVLALRDQRAVRHAERLARDREQRASSVPTNRPPCSAARQQGRVDDREHVSHRHGACEGGYGQAVVPGRQG